MTSTTTTSFRRLFAELPAAVQRQALKQYRWWKQDPHHPSLHFKEVGPDIWSVRISDDYRALAVREGDELGWYWIGKHAIYDRILKRR